MPKMGEERDMFESLRWEEEIISLRDPYIPFNPPLECERSAAK